MPPLLSLQSITKSYGSRTLFSDLSVSIDAGERVGLIGPNGAGKSTLLKIMVGQIDVDDGEKSVQRGLRIGYLEQSPTFKKDSSVLESILEGSKHADEGSSLTLAYELISKLGLEGGEKVNPETLVNTLSGGWKKRVALARELMREPDLLLLDEPTNHLDVESILWMENFLQRAAFASITITHDRYFLQKVASRIWELDRRNPGGLLSVKGGYEDYLEAKQELLANQAKTEQTLRNTLRREQEWLRAGVKARGTKQQARILRAGDLADQVSDLKSRNSSRFAGIEFTTEGHNPKKLLEAKNISKSLGDRCLFQDLNLLISPSSRIALLGPNGCGKSTLLRILLKQQNPDTGEIFHSDQMKVAYFEQNREALNPKLSLIHTLAPHGDQVIYRGNPIHVRGYLDRFLFTPAQMNMSIGQLSGGEQSRLLIARLMLQDANVLVLDEPTNDLDLETLAILEDCLTDFEGAVLLVTHDRFFLDRVATQIIAFHPSEDGRLEVFASLDQWQRWYEEEIKRLEKKQQQQAKSYSSNVSSGKKKLSYKEVLELDGMENNIHQCEEKLSSLEEKLLIPEIATNSIKLLEVTSEMDQVRLQLENFYKRWAELESKK